MFLLAANGETVVSAPDPVEVPTPPAKDRLWVNHERTVLVRLWANGNMEVATRTHPAETWGPPVYLNEEH